MNATEMRALSSEELGAKLTDMREEFFNLRFQHGVGQLENTSQLNKLRTGIARVKTIINELTENDKE